MTYLERTLWSIPTLNTLVVLHNRVLVISRAAPRIPRSQSSFAAAVLWPLATVVERAQLVCVFPVAVLVALSVHRLELFIRPVIFGDRVL